MTTSLANFITEVGDAKAGVLFQVKLRTVQSWRRGERFPRPEQARIIVDATNGRVDMQGIYGHGSSDPLARAG